MRQRTEQEVQVQEKLCDHVEVVITEQFNPELEELERQLMAAMGPEAQQLFLQLDRLQGVMHSRMMAEAFWQGASWIRGAEVYGALFKNCGRVGETSLH